jgi:hypothetical protein
MVNIAEEYKFGGLYQILKGIFDIGDKPEHDFFNYLGTDLYLKIRLKPRFFKISESFLFILLPLDIS